MNEAFGVAFIATVASFGVSFLINQLQKRGVFLSRRRQYKLLDPDVRSLPRVLGVIAMCAYFSALFCVSVVVLVFCFAVVTFLPLLIMGQGERFFSDHGLVSTLLVTGYGAAWLSLFVALVAHASVWIVLSTRRKSQN